MDSLRRLLGSIDGWQRRHRAPAVAYAVIKKFGDDQANQYVVGLGWYGFTAIYPLLLVVVTVFAFIGADSLGTGIVSTLHRFPVVGTMFNPANPSSSLHGSTLGLVIGLVLLLYGAQGVTQSAQQAQAQVWNIPMMERPGFVSRLVRSLLALLTIGVAFVVNSVAGSYATASGQPLGARFGVIAGMLVANWAFYAATFRALAPKVVTGRALLPGAAVGALGFTLLITVGTGLVQHQLQNSSATYGQFGAVIGLVGFLLLLAKISLYGAELNPVLARHLWPRSLDSDQPTDADRRILQYLARQQATRPEQHIGVEIDEPARTAREPEEAPAARS
jgi:uncharacterized BrkB/YihY/UPF0761 family membrane protein